MTLADVIATLRGHGSAQVCTLTPRECAEMAEVLMRLRDEVGLMTPEETDTWLRWFESGVDPEPKPGETP